MAGNPRSIRACFNDALPEYKYRGGMYTADDGGHSTNDTLPPLYAIQRSTTGKPRWVELGRQYFTTTLPQSIHKVQNNLQTLANAQRITPQDLQQRMHDAQKEYDAIESEFIHDKEGAIIHGNESDVVRTAAMYLIHPISQVLWAHADYRNAFCNQGEHTLGNKNTGLVRADLTFSKAAIPGSTRVFAVVEFKRRTMIRPSEFGNTLQPNQWPQGYDHSNPNHQQQARQYATNFPSTLFRDGALWLIKQAGSYATKYRTRYVALYNYDYLICCYFPQIDPSQSSANLTNSGVGSFVELDIYPFYDQNGNISTEMRLALLGFLEEALVETPP